jgi:hypothetical protein
MVVTALKNPVGMPPYPGFCLGPDRALAAWRVIKREELAIMLDEYYTLHGWDREGRPSARQVEEVIPEVEKISAI